jgi:hypothetical protein
VIRGRPSRSKRSRCIVAGRATRPATAALDSARAGRIRSAALTAGTSIAQIDAVEQRAGDARLIVGLAAHRRGRSDSPAAGHAAAARVHRRDQLEARRIGDAVIGAGDDAFAGFERLAQRCRAPGRELGQFVEEQHAIMRQRRLARPDAQAAADQRRHRGGMMRRAERPAVGQLAARQFARDRLRSSRLRAVRAGERRQDRRQALRQHRLARAGRPIISRLWPPAAATSSARRAVSWPLMSARSGRFPADCARTAARAATDLVPRKWLASAIRLRGARCRCRRRPMPPPARRHGADQPLPIGIGADRRRQRAGDRQIVPSSDSSPSTT